VEARTRPWGKRASRYRHPRRWAVLTASRCGGASGGSPPPMRTSRSAHRRRQSGPPRHADPGEIDRERALRPCIDRLTVRRYRLPGFPVEEWDEIIVGLRVGYGRPHPPGAADRRFVRNQMKVLQPPAAGWGRARADCGPWSRRSLRRAETSDRREIGTYRPAGAPFKPRVPSAAPPILNRRRSRRAPRSPIIGEKG